MELDDTAEIPVVTNWHELLDEQGILRELSDDELEELTHEAHTQAFALFNDHPEREDEIRNYFHVWRVGMIELDRRKTATQIYYG